MFTAVVLAATVAPAAPLPAGAVDLRWRFTAGDVFYMAVDQQIKQTIDVPGAPGGAKKQEMEVGQKMVVKVKVVSATESEKVLESTYVRATMTMKPETPAAKQMGELMAGLKTTMTLNGKNEVVKITGMDEFIDKAAGGNEAMKGMLKGMLTEDTLKQMSGQWFNGPGKLVVPGDTWKHDQSVALGPLGTMAITMTHTYKGETAGVAKTTYTGDLTWKAADGAVGGGIKVTKADFKADRLEGEALFDPALGRAKSMTTAMKMGGTLTMSANGNELTMGMDQELTMTMTVTTTEPK